MIIHVYMQVWNEAMLMPYLLRHYGAFTDKIIIYDDGSTDGTREIAAAHPLVELRDLGANGVDDDVFIGHWNEDYKQSRGIADWVILTDGDEFLYHPRMRELLAEYQSQGITFPLIRGFNMVSDNMPTTAGQIYEELYCGSPYSDESKRSVFNPHIDVAWWHGRHRIKELSANAVPSPTAEIALLHYLALGWDYHRRRRKSYRPRMSQRNLANNWGDYIMHEEETWHGAFLAGLQQSVPLVGIIEGAH